jgi:hypothetical protein
MRWRGRRILSVGLKTKSFFFSCNIPLPKTCAHTLGILQVSAKLFDVRHVELGARACGSTVNDFASLPASARPLRYVSCASRVTIMRCGSVGDLFSSGEAAEAWRLEAVRLSCFVDDWNEESTKNERTKAEHTKQRT